MKTATLGGVRTLCVRTFPVFSVRPRTEMRCHRNEKIMKLILAMVTALTAVGCTHETDMSAINAEARKAIKRYDIAQSLAANEKVVVASTQSGSVLTSQDGGRIWTRQTLGLASLIGLAVCPNGSFVGIDFNHKVWVGDPSGSHWKSAVLEKPRIPLTVSCDALGRWHVAGSGAKISRSSDQGASWHVVDLNEDAQITGLQMLDARHGIAVGEFGLFASTEDGGDTWTVGERLPGDFYPYAVLFTNRKEGYASGLAGTVLRTQDGGRSWGKIENSTGAALYRLFIHDGKPYGVGAGGALARLAGNGFEPAAYPDAAPVFLGAGTSVPGQSSIVVGGPGGLIRAVATQAN